MITDLHSHLLPGIDDGPATMDEAVALARAFVAGGVQRAVATPHVGLRYPNTAATIAKGVARLRAELERQGIPLVVEPGAEIAASHLPSLDPEELARLTLGGRGRWILLEPPMAAEFPIEGAARALQDAGFHVLLAHPERCRLFQRAPERVAALVDAGARVSVTAGALTGAFGRPPRVLARDLVKAGLVHNAVADAHSVDRRPPTLVADLERAKVADRIPAWCEALPATVLDGAA